MRVNRFFVNKPLGEETITDDVRLVHQIKNVLRLSVSDEVIFFNGKDSFDYLYTVKELTKRQIAFTFVGRNPVSHRDIPTVLYLSLIRKELFELSCLKATELGVTHIVPLLTDRVTRPHVSVDRLQTILIEGSEQSGRATVPLLLPEIHLGDIVSSLSSLAVPKENAYALSLFGVSSKTLFETKEVGASLAFFVGPEGGWSEEEESFFVKEGIERISVSSHTLRAETAAIICTYLPFFIRK
jgi:16S rRNA (uracil1498-N3)-methyltransferase